MNKEQVDEMLALLAREFKMVPPGLDWSARARNGHAWFGVRRLIQVGPRCWRGVEAATLHEFAHILQAFRSRPQVLSGHDARFWRALEDAVTAWHGDASRYPWRTEYKSGKAFAGRRQFLKEKDDASKT